jgi:hypothetical protein
MEYLGCKATKAKKDLDREKSHGWVNLSDCDLFIINQF